MKKYVNGEYTDMTAEDIADIETAVAEQMAAEATRPMTMEEVVRLTISKTINAIDIADETALRMVEYYPMPEAAQYNVGDRIQYDGKLYRCLQAHTAQYDWIPTNAPSLWAEVLAGQQGTEIGEWRQPDSTNPYMTGDKVMFGGEEWISTVDNNVWSPSVYGWQRV